MGQAAGCSDRSVRGCGLGRSTPAGQALPSGQFAENHAITASYFRAVKDAFAVLIETKNLPSPAARRPTVLNSRFWAVANAPAHLHRFERK